MEPTHTVERRLPSGRTVTVPVVPGMLKHPLLDQLREILTGPAAMEKCTTEALRKAHPKASLGRGELALTVKNLRRQPERRLECPVDLSAIEYRAGAD